MFNSSAPKSNNETEFWKLDFRFCAFWLAEHNFAIQKKVANTSLELNTLLTRISEAHFAPIRGNQIPHLDSEKWR